MLDKMTPAMYAATVAEPATLPGLPRWHAMYTCSCHEKGVSRQLRQKQIDCFLPLYRSVRRWKDRRKELQLPLFPGYVFVHIDDEDRLRVLQSPGVTYFVSCSGRPAVTEGGELEVLRRGVVNCAFVELPPYVVSGR